MESSCVALFGEVLGEGEAGGYEPGGAPLNVARHLAAFGLTPLLLSRVGEDLAGERLLHAMPRWGLATRGMQRDPLLPTGRTVAETDEGEAAAIPPGQAWDQIEALMAQRTLRAAQPVLFYFDTLAQRASQSCCTLWSLLPEAGGLRFLDLNLREPWYDRQVVEISLLAADVLMLCAEDLSSLTALLELQDAPSPVMSLLDRFSIREAFVTLGDDGAEWFRDDGTSASAPADVRGTDVVDTTGAGEAFAAVAILGLTSGWAPRTTLTRANAFAGAVCRINGATPETTELYAPFLEAWNGGSSRH